ncbi:hypothetical protein [Streptomyces sp. NPDC001274]
MISPQRPVRARVATRADIDAVAHILTTAFFHDRHRSKGLGTALLTRIPARVDVLGRPVPDPLSVSVSSSFFHAVTRTLDRQGAA